MASWILSLSTVSPFLVAIHTFTISSSPVNVSFSSSSIICKSSFVSAADSAVGTSITHTSALPFDIARKHSDVVSKFPDCSAPFIWSKSGIQPVPSCVVTLQPVSARSESPFTFEILAALLNNDTVVSIVIRLCERV